jgi:hypothetical protein
MNTNNQAERITLSLSQIILVVLAHAVILVAAIGLSVLLGVPVASGAALWLAVGWILVGQKFKSNWWPRPGWDIIGAFRLVWHAIVWPLVLAH